MAERSCFVPCPHGGLGPHATCQLAARGKYLPYPLYFIKVSYYDVGPD